MGGGQSSAPIEENIAPAAGAECRDGGGEKNFIRNDVMLLFIPILDLTADKAEVKEFNGRRCLRRARSAPMKDSRLDTSAMLKLYESSNENEVLILVSQMQLYQIGKLIGTGSFGEVFLCRHKEEQNFYVAKKLPIAERDQKGKDDIENELKILQKFNHPNIVEFKDSILTERGLYIMMMYCEGGDLHSKIRKIKEKGKVFSEGQILDWLTQMSLAIHYLHMNRVLHRDLKSQNIFIELDDLIEKVRIGDFGISKVLDENQDLTATTQIGSPYYMAPEIFNRNIYSYKSDIWSLGCIAYELCNLRLPFQAHTRQGLIMKVMTKSYPTISPHYSKQLRDLISQMLEKKPQKRPSILEVLNKPFIRARVDKYAREKLKIFSKTMNENKDIENFKRQIKMLGLQNEEAILSHYPSHASIGEIGDENFLLADLEKEKEGFVDHMRSMMVEKTKFQTLPTNDWKVARERKNIILQKIEEQKSNIMRFRMMEEYSMDDKEQIEEDFEEIIEEVEENQIEESKDGGERSLSFSLQEQSEEKSKTYYKIFNEVQLLKNTCESGLGISKFLKACQFVEKGANRATMVEVLGRQFLGYWHLIQQSMHYQSIIKEMKK